MRVRRGDGEGQVKAFLIAAADGRYLDGDDAALELLGISREQLQGLRIGDLSGPHAQLAREVWARLAPAGQPLPAGESTLYRPDGSAVRVRYLRIAPTAGGAFEIVFEPIEGQADEPPAASRPSAVLERWREIDRNGDDPAQGSAALRELYQHSVRARSGRQPQAPSGEPDAEPA